MTIETEGETLSDFKGKLDRAKLNRDEWVETSAAIIGYFNRNGLNGAKFYIHDGIKVCEFGKMQSILDEEKIQMSRKVHGVGEAQVLGNPA